MQALSEQKCFQCMESFSNESKLSKNAEYLVQMSSCHHKICSGCLKRIEQKNQSILSCGFCGVIVKGSQLNNMIQICKQNNKIQEYNIASETYTLEQFLDQKLQTDQMSFLLGSDSYKDLCQKQKNNRFKTNSIFFEETNSQFTALICKIHEKPLQIVCLADKQIICAHCAIFGDHKGHNVIQLNIIENELQKKKLKIGQIMTQEKEFQLKLKEKQLKSQYLKKIQVKKEESQNQIKKKFLNLRQMLMKSQQKALQNLRKCYELIQEKLNTCLRGQKQLKTIYSKWAQDTKNLLSQISLANIQKRVQIFLSNFTISTIQSPDIIQVDSQGKKYFEQMKQSLQISLKDIEKSLSQIKITFNDSFESQINKFVQIQFDIVSTSCQTQHIDEDEFLDNSFVQKLSKTLNITQKNLKSNMIKSNFQFKSYTPLGSTNRLLTQGNFSQTIKLSKSKSPKFKQQKPLTIKKPLKYNRRDTLQDYKNLSKKNIAFVKSSIDCQQIISTLSITDQIIDIDSTSKNYKNKVQKTQRKQIKKAVSPDCGIKTKLSRCRSNDGQFTHRKKASMDTMDSKFPNGQNRQPNKILQEFKKGDSQIFDLSNCNLSDSQIIYYLQKGKNIKKIKNLKISSNKLTNTGLQKIIPYLASCSLLNVSHNFLTQQILDYLLKKKQKLTNLKMVNVSNNKMNSDPKKLKIKIQNLKKVGIMITL